MKKVRLLTTAAAAVPAAVAATVAVATNPAVAATMRPEAVTQQTCSPVANKNWVHIHTRYHGSQCFGGAGLTHPDYFASSICPGNNSISYGTRSHYGQYATNFAAPGTGWFPIIGYPPVYVSWLRIIKWTGNATC
jgi:hypothetical protein